MNVKRHAFPTAASPGSFPAAIGKRVLAVLALLRSPT
jgi:hypothetical protein